ncbi:MAG: hypothetical protein IT232_08600 [Flavobacteriales bacterium]|nr:hypothetical protein [Flavobacteriales bacterium]
METFKLKKQVKHISGKFLEVEEYFKSLKRPFRVVSNNYTTKIGNEREEYIISSEFVGFGFIKLLTKFKSEVKANIEKMELTKKDIKYFNCNFDFFHSEEGSVSGIEIDISQAYLWSTYYCKFISKETLEKFLTLKKSTRLKLIGSLASRKNVFNYDEAGKLINQEVKKDDRLLLCWNNICYQVDDYINHLIYINDYNKFVFYWFDNLFFNIKDFKSFNCFDRKYILKHSQQDLSYIWNKKNILNIQIENRLFNFKRSY